MTDAFHAFEHAGWGNESIAQAYHRHIADVTTGCIPALLAAAKIGPGHKVLDVACGAGYVAASARDLGAHATGTDFSAAQITLAQQTYPDIRFVDGDAEALPFGDGEFHAVLNAFGFPHIPNADRATAESFRVLRPGGNFAYASWCDPAKCIGFSMIYDAVRQCGTLDVGLPPGPDFFGCGRPEVARTMLGNAGFISVTTTEVPLVWRASSPDTIIDGIACGTVRASAVFNRQTAEARDKIKQYLRECISQYEKDGGYVVPSPALVVAGTKPR